MDGFEEDRNGALERHYREIEDELLHHARSSAPFGAHPLDEPHDLVQCACVQALKKYHCFRGSSEAELRAWLRRIVELECRNSIRRAQVEERLMDAVAEAYDGRRRPRLDEIECRGPSPLEFAITTERNRIILEALTSLSKLQQRLVELIWAESSSMEDAAERVGISTDSAYKCFRRAIEALRRLLEKLPEFTERR